MSLLYADRAERYARQAGWTYDPQRISIDKLTPHQRKRALKKEGHELRRRAYAAARAQGITLA